VKKAEEILARLLEKGPAGAPAFHSLFGGWQEIAGPSLAEHCRAYEVRHHSLLVEADHPGWMQLFLMQKKPILARIRQRFPQLDLRDIKVRVNAAGPGRGSGDAPSPGKPRPAAQAQAQPPAQVQTPQAAPGATAPGLEAPKVPPPVSPGVPPGVPPSAEVQEALAAVGEPELREKLRLLLQELERRGAAPPGVDAPD
jgi:hypothetical protein